MANDGQIAAVEEDPEALQVPDFPPRIVQLQACRWTIQVEITEMSFFNAWTHDTYVLYAK